MVTEVYPSRTLLHTIPSPRALQGMSPPAELKLLRKKKLRKFTKWSTPGEEATPPRVQFLSLDLLPLQEHELQGLHSVHSGGDG